MPDEHDHSEQEKPHAPPAASVGSDGGTEGAGEAADAAERPRRHIWPWPIKRPRLRPGGERGWSLLMESVVTFCAVVVMIVTWGMWKETKESVALTRRSVEATEEALRLAEEGGEEAREQAEADRELTRRSVKATEDALKLTRESNRLTSSGVEIARQSLNLNRKALDLSQRPWLTVQDVAFIQPLQAGSPMAVDASIFNSGHSPALDTAIRTSLEVLNSPPPDSAILAAEDKHYEPSRIVVGAGETVRFGHRTVPNPMDEETLRQIKARALRLFLYGIIEYRDVFGAEHVTRFCSFWEPEHGFWRSCQTHNSSS